MKRITMFLSLLLCGMLAQAQYQGPWGIVEDQKDQAAQKRALAQFINAGKAGDCATMQKILKTYRIDLKRKDVLHMAWEAVYGNRLCVLKVLDQHGYDWYDANYSLMGTARDAFLAKAITKQNLEMVQFFVDLQHRKEYHGCLYAENAFYEFMEKDYKKLIPVTELSLKIANLVLDNNVSICGGSMDYGWEPGHPDRPRVYSVTANLARGLFQEGPHWEYLDVLHQAAGGRFKKDVQDGLYVALSHPKVDVQNAMRAVSKYDLDRKKVLENNKALAKAFAQSQTQLRAELRKNRKKK